LTFGDIDETDGACISDPYLMDREYTPDPDVMDWEYTPDPHIMDWEPTPEDIDGKYLSSIALLF